MVVVVAVVVVVVAVAAAAAVAVAIVVVVVVAAAAAAAAAAVVVTLPHICKIWEICIYESGLCLVHFKLALFSIPFSYLLPFFLLFVCTG